MSKILIVEDDLECANLLASWLANELYVVEIATTGNDALQILRNFRFDVIILDWELPSISGFELLRIFRAEGGKTPILFLTGKADLDSKTLSFEVGADDYLTKPYEPRELSARIKALLRRPAGLLPKKIKIGELALELETKRVLLLGKSIRLTTKEYGILEFLMMHPNEVFSAKALLAAVWPSSSESSEDAVRTCMVTLRRKITAPGKDCIVKTIPSTGYIVEFHEP